MLPAPYPRICNFISEATRATPPAMRFSPSTMLSTGPRPLYRVGEALLLIRRWPDDLVSISRGDSHKLLHLGFVRRRLRLGRQRE